MNQKVWESLRDMFETDDGSLPDVYILNLSGRSVSKIWAYLRESSGTLVVTPRFGIELRQRVLLLIPFRMLPS